jgi:hypothetical protein
MIVWVSRFNPFHQPAAFLALLALCAALTGCAELGENMSSAFADPAKYDLYDCKQLEPERKNLARRTSELQGLMSKAETGFAGPVVAEMAYRNDYIAVRGQSKLAEEAWQRNKCQETPASVASPTALTPGSNARPASRSRAGTAIR